MVASQREDIAEPGEQIELARPRAVEEILSLGARAVTVEAIGLQHANHLRVEVLLVQPASGACRLTLFQDIERHQTTFGKERAARFDGIHDLRGEAGHLQARPLGPGPLIAEDVQGRDGEPRVERVEGHRSFVRTGTPQQVGVLGGAAKPRRASLNTSGKLVSRGK